jgi:hypothetical protein
MQEILHSKRNGLQKSRVGRLQVKAFVSFSRCPPQVTITSTLRKRVVNLRIFWLAILARGVDHDNLSACEAKNSKFIIKFMFIDFFVWFHIGAWKIKKTCKEARKIVDQIPALVACSKFPQIHCLERTCLVVIQRFVNMGRRAPCFWS